MVWLIDLVGQICRTEDDLAASSSKQTPYSFVGSHRYTYVMKVHAGNLR